MAFEGSSLQSRIFGVGTVVLDWTGQHARPQLLSFIQEVSISPYVIVATSELVVSLAGPATEVGSLATTRLALSQVKMKIRLYPPSFFSYLVMEVAPGHSSITLWRSASKSKFKFRELRSSSSRRSHLPLVYLRGSRPVSMLAQWIL